MWTSVGFVFAVCVFLDAHVNGEVFEWKRNVNLPGKKPLIVQESADVLETVIVMKSADIELDGSGINRSISYHDFEKEVLAIRNLDANKGTNICLLTTPKTDYDTTRKAIEQRKGRLVQAVEAKNYLVKSEVITKSGSDVIDNKYCEGAVMYRLVPILEVDKRFIDIGRTQCIWNPLQYYWDDAAITFKGY